ncbi:MAG: hypothetical protein H7Z40_18510 [Phycisphaerae bacterium]|nr:hypothetical protein [Gemmatimonadaceae bacterium]
MRPSLKTLCAGVVTVVALCGCDKVKEKLYATTEAAVDQSWVRDSAFVARSPRLLFRTVKKDAETLTIPIGVLSNSGIRTLRMSKRGWNYLDVVTLNAGQPLTPVQDGLPASAAKVRQRMWENAASPVDTITGCPNMIPAVKVSLPAGTHLAVMNYSLPTTMKSLSSGEVEDAVSSIPQLVAPMIGIRAGQLSQYTRRLHQVLRIDEPPAVLAEYHDESAQTDTSVVATRRPRHLIIVMEKGVYGYRPGWVYSTTGKPNERPILRFLEAMDADGDGRAELFFDVNTPIGPHLLVFRKKLDAWTEMWRRPPVRCDV